MYYFWHGAMTGHGSGAGCTLRLRPCRAGGPCGHSTPCPHQSTGTGAAAVWIVPVGTAVTAAGGPGAESHAGRDADAAGE